MTDNRLWEKSQAEADLINNKSGVQREVTHPDWVENVPLDSGLSDYLYARILTTARVGC